MRFHNIFGDINAENDDLLFECKVIFKNERIRKPIITGRWGTGKTAQMLLQNEKQIEFLTKVDYDKRNLWYISERNMTKSTITDMYEVYHSNLYKFDSVLGNMWKAEILRIYVILINLFKDNDQYPKVDHKSAHWSELKKLNSTNGILKSSSNFLGEISKVIFKSKREDISDTRVAIEELLNEKTHIIVRKCLLDLLNLNYTIPQLVIEPIETPHSDFEKDRSLATSIVRSLIEVYVSKFYPSKDNPFNVRLVIPWHRLTNEISFPQKITDSVGFIGWNKNELFKFISNRIQWEFKRVNRKLTKRSSKGLWYELFDNNIQNGWTKDKVSEDSFDYFIRHTHMRSRDLINLCKVCVEEMVEQYEQYINSDEVLKSGFIDKSVIKSAFRKFNQTASEELIGESIRKYWTLKPVFDSALFRLPIIFSYDELKSRFVDNNIKNPDQRLLELWESGVIGITATEDSDEINEMINMYSGELGKRVVDKNIRWTWFFYNSTKSPIDMIRTLEAFECEDYGYCLHPKLFEKFTPILDKNKPLNIPIGVC